MRRSAFAAVLSTLVALAVSSVAHAGPPGSWTQVAAADSNTPEIGLARPNGGVLNILSTRDKTVINTQLSPDAKSLTGPHTVFSYPDDGGAVMNRLSLLPGPGDIGLRAFFAGLYPNHPLDRGVATATSADGVTWAVQPTLASDSRVGQRSSVYAAAGIGGTIAGDGTPVSVWGDSAPGQAGYHIGLNEQDSDVHFGGPSATAGGPNAATNPQTGEVAIAWNDLDSGKTLVQVILPAVGPRLEAPGADAPDALERVGMTGRINGIYVAYLEGTNPFLGRPAVWRIGAPKPMIVSRSRRARFPGVDDSVKGRLWAFWAGRADNAWRVYGARSNTSATNFGALVSLPAPAGTQTIHSLEGDGRAPGAMLDLVALAQGAGGTHAQWHQRMRPGITLSATPLGQGDVRFTTLDAGSPLNTKITFAAKTASTGPDGKVVMNAAPGKRKATATRTGYHPAARTVNVR